MCFINWDFRIDGCSCHFSKMSKNKSNGSASSNLELFQTYLIKMKTNEYTIKVRIFKNFSPVEDYSFLTKFCHTSIHCIREDFLIQFTHKVEKIQDGVYLEHLN